MSAQGEHVFNAVGDLAQSLIPHIQGVLATAREEARARDRNQDYTHAEVAITRLQSLATQFISARNHADFRTAPHGQGDPTNDWRYSQFAQSIRRLVEHMVFGGPTLSFQTRFDALIRDSNQVAIDAIARTNARRQLNAARQQQFDRWFNTTSALMTETLEALKAAAVEVAHCWSK
ncbi:hypothetical protein [Parachitinimonas caeni]|uniref:Uncharacterized protein n=1 Tax=Parachitinimonas caeni TaxID=3031301 RepID=A0ABT7DU81_9NEIS|nr:hypothetical protein [Parachitinimonas caeni]MDK2123635.1 hypothetical protein [Parachitinimonas caeni]